nr:MAG TPA: hypothetical protein [Caudoviricetes sp.]
MKRIFIPMWRALKEARECDSNLTVNDGICACYDVENMGFLKNGTGRWYHFTSVSGVPAYTIKR